MRAFFIYSVLFLSFGFLTSCAQRLDEYESRLSDLDERSRILESKMGLPVGNDRELLESRRLADVRTQVAALKNENTVLRGRIEASEFESEAIKSELQKQRQDFDIRLRRLESGTSATAVPGQVDDKEAKYWAAVRAHQAGDFDKSQGLFEAFIEEYKKDSLTDNALYWLGESYLVQREYRKAMVRFQDLIEKFPQSDKKCDAMERQVEGFRALGMKEEASAYSKVRSEECSSATQSEKATKDQ